MIEESIIAAEKALDEALSNETTESWNEKYEEYKNRRVPLIYWIDDIRDPDASYNGESIFDTWVRRYAIEVFGYDSYNVKWCMSYDEFVEAVKEKMPDAVCFDHDLGMTDTGEVAKSGLDCARFLINYCLNHDLELPKYAVQSCNPVGRANILAELRVFDRIKEKLRNL